MHQLFREEAIRNRHADLFGGIAVPAGRLATLLALAAMILAGCLVALLATGTLARKERAYGYLVPTSGLTRVPSPRSGHVERVFIAEGQRVAAGTSLFSVSSARTAPSGIQVDAEQVRFFRAEEKTLRDLAGVERALAERHRDNVRRRAAEFRLRQTSAIEQRRHADARRSLLQKEVERLASLHARGNIAASVYESKQAELLHTQQELLVLDRELGGYAGEAAALDAELEQIPLRLEVRIAEIESRLLALRRSLAEAEVQQATIVRAPVAGRVTALLAHEGMSVTAQQPLLSLLPHATRLQAEILIPTRAAGFIRTGQPVRLRYDAFPYQKFGTHGATVESISRTVLNPDDQIGPVRLGGPAYRVVATLQNQTVAAYGDRLPLQPGLTLQADIIRDRRTVIEWIFDPVFAAARGL
jgi:membrane fusion protein